FFSSRRRHTRSKRDWSSDVCSSDLSVQAGHCQYRVPFIIKGAFPITAFYHCQLPGENFRKKIPISAGWLQKSAFNSFCFLFYKRSEERRVGKECRERRQQ